MRDLQVLHRGYGRGYVEGLICSSSSQHGAVKYRLFGKVDRFRMYNQLLWVAYSIGVR